MDNEEIKNQQTEQNPNNEGEGNSNRPAYRRVNVYGGAGKTYEGNNYRRSYGERSYNSNYQRRDRDFYPQERRNDGGYRSERNYGQRRDFNNPAGRRPNYDRSYQGGQEYNRGGYGYERRPRIYNAEKANYSADNQAYKESRGGRYEYRQNYNGAYGERGGRNYARRPYSQNYDPNAKYSMRKRVQYAEENYDPDAPIRLNKFLANAGVCSRRDADKYIQAGVVTVNGETITELGTKVKRSDDVRFHNEPVSPEKKVYVLLNKPKDYVTTSDDPQKRKTVMDLVRNACKERIYPVGRLDRNTTGVLLLTNDGELASKLTHPKFLKKKIYHVYLDRNVTAADMRQIADGITLDDGEIHADAVEYASEVDKKQVGIEIHSGKNRIVRRIFESLGYHVIKLDRVYFAGLTKKNLRRGQWRYLSQEEVNVLKMGAFE